MNSLGPSSKWPSYDSPPSTPGFLLSESEQTEDEADVLSEEEGDSGVTKCFAAGEQTAFSGKRIAFRDHSEPAHSRSENEQSEHCLEKTKHVDHSPGTATLGSSSPTPGDLAFAQKVSIFKVILKTLCLCFRTALF